jgi:hypothetical protein
MTGEQGTLDSSLGGGYMNKAGSYGPAVFKTAELVSIKHLRLITFFYPKKRKIFACHEN